jgi:16S rRNA (cytidine1402-2'-O)-methyltransferase
MKGKLFLVSTPIGNMEDITFRAVETLRDSDVIFCEDTRVSKKLFERYDISSNYDSYNAHAGDSKTDRIFDLLKEGKSVSLISDAGTPTLSDPGSKIVSDVWEEFSEEIKSGEIEIIAIPGASALLTGFATSGFFGGEFTFRGFLPHKKGRETIFNEIKEDKKINIFYESPHRIMKALKSLSEILEEDRNMMVCKELTKIHESKIRGSVKEVLGYFENNPDRVKGEFMVIIDGK